MARRNSNSDVLDREDEGTEVTPEVSATEPTPEVESTEAGNEESDAPEPGTEGETPRDTSGDTEHLDGQVQVSLEPFEQAAQAAVAQRDTNTGELPEGALEPVLAQYRELGSTKDRNRAKNYLKDQMKVAMEALDLSLARSFYTLSESMTTSAPSKGGDKKPADPLGAWKSNLLTSLIAYGELAGAGKPEEGNVEEVQAQASSTEVIEEINAYRAWLDTEVPEDGEKPEAPKVRPEVLGAFRLVRGTRRVRAASGGAGTSTPHDGPRRDLGKHIAQAFENVESGTFLSVADIRKFQSDEYGDEQPSAGAISARLFPAKGECTIEGIRPGTGGEKGTKGAYKE